MRGKNIEIPPSILTPTMIQRTMRGPRATFAIPLVLFGASAGADSNTYLLEFMSLAGNPPSPQIRYFKSSKGGRALLLGIRHTTDPSDAQFDHIRTAVERFSPTIVLNEGGDWPVHSDAITTIRRSGEAGFVRYLASRRSIPVEGVDPAFYDELEFVKARHGAQSAKLYYALRYYSSIKQDADWSSHLTSYLNTITMKFALSGPPRVVEDISSLSQRAFGIHSWRAVEPIDVSPVGTLSDDVRLIAQSSNDFRETYSTNRISSLVLNGERVLVVYGWGHLVSQETSLRCLIESVCAK